METLFSCLYPIPKTDIINLCFSASNRCHEENSLRINASWNAQFGAKVPYVKRKNDDLNDKWDKDFREILLYLINLPFLLSCFQVKWLFTNSFWKG